MSFAVTAVGLLGLGVSMHQANMAEKSQKSAMNEARIAAAKREKDAEQAFNAANRKKPDISGTLRDSAMGAGRAGISGTMLTGPSGVDAASLSLGRTTLLGS